MTIKELCDKYQHCVDCPLYTICCINDWIYRLFKDNEQINKDITNAIIETAKKLTESERENI